MFVALTLAIKRREAPKMSHTQFLRSPQFALTPIWCAKQKGGLIILLCILIFMAQCVLCTCSTLWENRGDYWEISDVLLQITLMNISKRSTLFTCVRRIVYENALALIGIFSCAVKFVQIAATRRNNFEHF